jgi:hypothetical protein
LELESAVLQEYFETSKRDQPCARYCNYAYCLSRTCTVVSIEQQESSPMITTHGFAVQSATSVPAPFDIEMTSFGNIEEAWERVIKGDVKYHFVLDLKTLKSPHFSEIETDSQLENQA